MLDAAILAVCRMILLYVCVCVCDAHILSSGVLCIVHVIRMLHPMRLPVVVCM